MLHFTSVNWNTGSKNLRNKRRRYNRPMRRLVLLSALFCVSILSAQEKTGGQPAPAISPVRQEILSAFDSAANRALSLAKAVPEDKYAWRPMEGVRSFKEVFVHMGGSTLLFGSYAGLKPPSS